MKMTRKEFVRSAALVGAGAAASGALVFHSRRSGSGSDPTGAATVRELDGLTGVPPTEQEDLLLRMQRELARAMAKPVEERHWIMVIDTRKCVGCHACTVSCIAENKLPPGVVYRPVVTEEAGTFPNVAIHFTPRPCMQCANPPCTSVCPVHATWKRPDGVVTIDYDRCIGCRYCLTACPYGARTSDFGLNYADEAAAGATPGVTLLASAPYEAQPNHEYAKSWSRVSSHGSPKGNARKCHFCLHRLEGGQLPMCTTSCIGRATFFGDHNDPDSLVTGLVTHHNVQTLLPHKNAQPNVFYIV